LKAADANGGPLPSVLRWEHLTNQQLHTLAVTDRAKFDKLYAAYQEGR
jgi:hypothetical protein